MNIYLAAPLRNDDQRAMNKCLAALMENHGHSVYLPQEYMVLSPLAPIKDRDAVFHSNCVAMENAEALVAVLDEKDTGVIWEMGYCYRREPRPVIIGYYHNPVSSVNVMLLQGAHGLIKGSKDLELWSRGRIAFPSLKVEVE